MAQDNKNNMTLEKATAMKTLSSSKELYTLISLCTKLPFVICDPETFDDEVLMYEKEEDVHYGCQLCGTQRIYAGRI